MNIYTIPTYYISNIYYEFIVNSLTLEIDNIPISDIKSKRTMQLLEKRNRFNDLYKYNRDKMYDISLLNEYINTNTYTERNWISNIMKKYLLSIDPIKTPFKVFENDVRNHLKTEHLMQII